MASGIILIGLSVLSLTNAQFPQPRNPQFQPQPNNIPPNFNQPQPNNIQPNFNQPQNQPILNQPTLPQQLPTQQPGVNQPGSNMNLQPGTNPGPNQQNPNVNQQNPDYRCASAGRTAVAQCFQANGGFSMEVIIALLSNGTQSQLPPNYAELKNNLCLGQNKIVACIFNNIRAFNGTQQCSTINSFIRLEQETIGLLNGVQQVCGTGLMPPITECMRRVNYDMTQCYQSVGLNPALFAAGTSRIQGAVIGDNREVSNMFCRKRKDLFACQNRVLNGCPRVNELQTLSGQDQISSQKSMDVLCKDVNVYVSGLVCFQSPSDSVEMCANQMVRDMTELTMVQIQQALPAPAFLTRYCRVRIKNLQCDAAAWGKSCEQVTVGLKREFQCSLLPSVCKNDTEIKDLYQRACSETSFSRALRSTDNGVGVLAASVTSVASAFFAVLFLL